MYLVKKFRSMLAKEKRRTEARTADEEAVDVVGELQKIHTEVKRTEDNASLYVDTECFGHGESSDNEKLDNDENIDGVGQLKKINTEVKRTEDNASLYVDTECFGHGESSDNEKLDNEENIDRVDQLKKINAEVERTGDSASLYVDTECFGHGESSDNEKINNGDNIDGVGQLKKINTEVERTEDYASLYVDTECFGHGESSDNEKIDNGENIDRVDQLQKIKAEVKRTEDSVSLYVDKNYSEHRESSDSANLDMEEVTDGPDQLKKVNAEVERIEDCVSLYIDTEYLEHGESSDNTKLDTNKVTDEANQLKKVNTKVERKEDSVSLYEDTEYLGHEGFSDAVKDLAREMKNREIDASNASENLHDVNDVCEVESPNESIPSIFVDALLLPSKDLTDLKSYEINGETFRAVEKIEDSELVQFEIRSQDKEVQELRNDAQANASDGDLKQFSVQDTSYGIIINDTVTLDINSWHTIVDDQKCIVCDLSDLEDTDYHIRGEEHITNLNCFKPLKEFDLNIIRKINNIYHCGICNVIFDDTNEHLENDLHGGRMLESINRTSDIMSFDTNRTRNPNCINFNLRRNESDFDRNHERNISNENVYLDSFRYNETSNNNIDDDGDFDGFNDVLSECNSDDGNSAFSYADIAKKPKTFITPKYVKVKLNNKDKSVKFYNWNMLIALKNNKYYCMACQTDGPIRFKTDHCVEARHIENLMKCTLLEEYTEHVIRKVNDKLLHCGTCNNLQMAHEMQEHIMTTHINYANMNLIDPLTTGRTSKIAKTDHTRNASPKPAITDKINVRNGNTAEVPKNMNHFTSNDNGNESNDHTRNVSPKPTISDNKNTTDVPKNINIHNGDTIRNENNDHTRIVSPKPVITVPNNTNVLPETIVIREFGYSFRVSLLSYNFIQKQGPGFYCYLCGTPVLNVFDHITKNMVHVNLSTLVPFWLPAGLHLIRRIAYGFHCLICNYFVYQPLQHTFDHMHAFLLNICLSSASLPTAPLPGAPISDNKHCEIMQTINPEPNESNEETQRAKEDMKVKNTGNEVTETVITESETEINEFDQEQFVYIKIKNSYAKITLTSYNTFVSMGRGLRYCFLCSADVFDLSTHANSGTHCNKLKICKFLEKYERHLLRQVSSSYHCALCNVIIDRNFLSEHLSWAPHNEVLSNKIVKNTRRNEIKAGVKEITCETQKEIVSKDKDEEWKIILNVVKPSAQKDIVKTKKIVKIDDVILKISWDAFHGVAKKKNEYRCLLCDVDFKNYELSTHLESPKHANLLNEGFMLEYAPNLIRKVNATTFHCLTCNITTSEDHLQSKQHLKRFQLTIDTDIGDSDVLILTGLKK